MNKVILKAENISKQYRLGIVGTGTISHDLNRWWYKIRGKEDPYLQVGETNDRNSKGNSDYVWALKDINFEVYQGEVLGIIGKNGAGKSTLLKILSKVTSPTKGSIKSKGRIASLLEVGTGFHPELTGRENIFLNGAILGMSKAEIRLKLEEIIDFSGCERYIDTPVKRYSSGMKVRLAFAVAAHLEPEILVVDEVLAVGDAEFQKKAIGKMQDISSGQGRTVLFVSHDMGAINALCERVVVLEDGCIAFDGDASKAINYYLKTANAKKDLQIGVNTIESVFIEKNDAFVSGESLSIKINLAIKESIDSPVFSIILNNQRSQRICEFHSQGVAFNETFRNNSTIHFKVENLNLHIGSYYIDLIYYNGKRYEFQNVAQFNCVKVKANTNKFHKKENDFFFNYSYNV